MRESGKRQRAGEQVVIDGLTATQGIFGGVNLAWTLNATDATLLSVYRSTDGGSYNFLIDSDLSMGITTTSTTFFDDASEGHIYSYKLQATLPGGNSNFSDPAGISKPEKETRKGDKDKTRKGDKDINQKRG